jgi:hypothetical protein
VSKHLEAALRDLRSSFGCQLGMKVWADALCINQADVVDRNTECRVGAAVEPSRCRSDGRKVYSRRCARVSLVCAASRFRRYRKIDHRTQRELIVQPDLPAFRLFGVISQNTCESSLVNGQTAP